MNFYLSLIVIFMCNISVAQANLVTGIGYISPEEYRTDNEIIHFL